MKPLPLWSLSKTPETDAYALSSSSRTTSLLVSKKSDGRISHDSREKEDSLSLKIKTKPSASHSFSPHVFSWLFPLFYPFLFSFLCFSHFSSHPISFSFIFSSFPPFSLNFSPLFGALTVWVKRRKLPHLLPQAKCVAILFPSFSFIS